MLTCHLLMDRWEDSFQELIFSFHHRFQGSATGHQTLTASIFYLLYLLASPLLGFCIMSAMKSNHWVFAYMYISTLHVCRACRNEKKASDSLKLGLQTFMNCRCGCWKPNPSSLFERATTSFTHTPPAIFPAPLWGFVIIVIVVYWNRISRSLGWSWNSSYNWRWPWNLHVPALPSECWDWRHRPPYLSQLNVTVLSLVLGIHFKTSHVLYSSPTS